MSRRPSPPRLSRRIAMVAVAPLLCVAPSLGLRGQDPGHPPLPNDIRPRIDLELPSHVQLPDPSDGAGPAVKLPRGQEMIRKAIQTGRFDATGDPFFDEAMRAAKSRGSVLEGSVLDPARDGEWSVVDPSGLDSPRSTAGDRDPKGRRSRNARVAEQLLKASRLLSGLIGKDSDRSERPRSQLVRRMRAEAEKLLAE